MTEIKLSYTVSRAGEIVTAGTLCTFDLSFPARVFDSLARKYDADHIRVRDSLGQIWEKDFSRE